LFVSEDAFLAGWADDALGGETDAPDMDPPAEESNAPEAAPAPAAPKVPEDAFKSLEDEMIKTVKERVQKRLKEELNPTPVAPAQSSMAPNSTIVKDAFKKDDIKIRYLSGLDALVRTASSDTGLIDAIANYNDQQGIKIPVSIYRASLKVGSSDKYSSINDFRGACASAIGREPTILEVKTLLRLGKLLARGSTRSENSNIGSRQGGPT
jgi:hypothetical protein